MDFQLNAEQQAISDLAFKFAKQEIMPNSAKYDLSKEFPTAIHEQAQKLGLLGINLSEQYGGGGLNCMELVLVTEALCYGCLGIGTALCINALATEPINIAGSTEQKEKYLSIAANGGLGSFAMTEPSAGSDVAGIKATAKKVTDGYILNGSKTWISNANLANFLVVFAKTDPNQGHKGISAFIVDKDTHGLKIGAPLSKLGQRCAPTCEVFLDDVFVPNNNLLGNENSGFNIAMQVFDHSRPMVAAFAVGLIARCLDESLAYACERSSMGKRLIDHQAIAHKLAEMRIKLESARLLTYQSASLLDQKKSNTIQASMAKAYAADAAMWAACEAVQIFGGMGYSTEYPIEKLFRDAKVLQIYEGTSEIQRNIIARELYKTIN